MTDPGRNDEQPDSVAQNVAQNVFSSEKREDIWALVIAAAIFLGSVAFPAQIHAFFSSVLVLF